MKHPKKLGYFQRRILGRKLVQGEITKVKQTVVADLEDIWDETEVTLYEVKMDNGKVYRAGVRYHSEKLKEGDKVELFVDPYQNVAASNQRVWRTNEDGKNVFRNREIYWDRILSHKKLS